jgi:hypothetical protein
MYALQVWMHAGDAMEKSAGLLQAHMQPDPHIGSVNVSADTLPQYPHMRSDPHIGSVDGACVGRPTATASLCHKVSWCLTVP